MFGVVGVALTQVLCYLMGEPVVLVGIGLAQTARQHVPTVLPDAGVPVVLSSAQTDTFPHRCTSTPSSAKTAAFASSALSAVSESGA